MKKNKFKGLILLSLVLAIVIGTVGGTIAWLQVKTDPIVNVFTPGTVDCEVEEDTFDRVTKKNVKIQNTGDTKAYIRAAIVGYWCDTEGNIVAPWDNPIETPTGWSKSGDYYYCDTAVEPSEYTPVLITSYTAPDAPVEGAHLVIDILAQAIQAEPEKARTEAWGYPAASAE